MTVNIDFVLMMHWEDPEWLSWASITSLKNNPSTYLDYLRGLKEPNESDLQGGYAIYIDKKPWNVSSFPKEDGVSGPDWELDWLWMSENWLTGLIKIVRGADEASVSFWEESSAKIRRDGNNLILSDKSHWDGRDTFPVVSVDLHEFQNELIRVTEVLVHFLQRMKKDIEQLPPAHVELFNSVVRNIHFEDKLAELKTLVVKN